MSVEGGGSAQERLRKHVDGGWGAAQCAARLLYRVPVLCLIESMSALKTGQPPHTPPPPPPPSLPSPRLTHAADENNGCETKRGFSAARYKRRLIACGGVVH